MTDTHFFTDKLMVIACAECSVSFGMVASMDELRREDGKVFFCPSGHRNFYGECELSRLQKAVAAERAAKERAEAGERHHREMREHESRVSANLRGQATKLRKRLGAGVCPCCRRNFVALGRHLRSQHPDYSEGGK